MRGGDWLSNVLVKEAEVAVVVHRGHSFHDAALDWYAQHEITQTILLLPRSSP